MADYNPDHQSSEVAHHHIPKKAASIRSKGFSIPLNASYCINSIPINCVHHQHIYHAPPIQPQAQTTTPPLYHQQQQLDQEHDDDANDADEDVSTVESLHFQKKNFDLEEENSCLKEVNMRLRFAEVRKNYLNESTCLSTRPSIQVIYCLHLFRLGPR